MEELPDTLGNLGYYIAMLEELPYMDDVISQDDFKELQDIAERVAMITRRLRIKCRIKDFTEEKTWCRLHHSWNCNGRSEPPTKKRRVD